MPMNVVVTGSNTGLGLELCKQFHARGDNVYATCRNSSPELEAVGVAKIITNIDVTSADAADTLVSALRDVKIDALINNGRERVGAAPHGIMYTRVPGADSGAGILE